MLSIVSTASGQVSGTKGVHAAIFRGIPYATAKRFCPPEPYPRWEGVRPCTQFAAHCIQAPARPGVPFQDFYLREYGTAPTFMAEDSLCLNIWTPAETAEDKLPVLVWLHGGGHFSGSGDDLPFDGEAIAAEGAILVTLNHRIGCFAFFAHPALSAAREDGVSGNNDLRDQQAALRWVRDNIAAFGGDPDNVTLIGQSTGGGSVVSHLCIPSSRGLFQKAAIMSGLGTARAYSSSATLADAERWGEQVCACAGVTVDALQAMSAPALLELFRRAEDTDAGIAPIHVKDDVLLPVFPGREILRFSRPELPLLLSVVGDDRSADAEAAVCRNRAKAGGETYLAFFHPEIPGRNLPGSVPDGTAYHNADLWFLFGTLSRCWRPFGPAHAALSRTMTRLWAQFARSGRPEGWKPWSQDGAFVLDLTARDPYAVSIPAADSPGLQEMLDPWF